MTENTTAQALLTDHQGDRCHVHRYGSRLYVTVARDEHGGHQTAGPFTTAELRAAVESAAGEADPDPHTGPSASELLATLNARTSERDGARRERDALWKSLRAAQERSAGLLDRARSAEKDRDDNVTAREEVVNRLSATLTERTRERDTLQEALDGKVAAHDARVRRDAAEEVRQYIKRLHRKGLTSQDAVLADIEIAADRLGRGIHANGRDRETP